MDAVVINFAQEAARLAALESARIAAIESARIAAMESAKLAAQESAKLAAQEAAKLAAQEAAKLAAQEAAKVAAQEGAKVAVKEASKVAVQEFTKDAALSAVPFIGLGFGIVQGVWRIAKNPTKPESYLKAAVNVAAGVFSTVPGIGTAVSIGLNVGVAATDVIEVLEQSSSKQIAVGCTKESSVIWKTRVDLGIDGTDQITVIGSNETLNKAAISLLENDVDEFIRLLKSIQIDLEFAKEELTAEQIVKLLAKSNCQSGFNMSILQKVIQQTGKKAKAMVQSSVKILVEQAKVDMQSKEKDDKIRSDRGEHVINNSVLTVHKQIIDEFAKKRVFNHGRFERFEEVITSIHSTQLATDYSEPFNKIITSDIQDRMVAHIPDDQFYFNANAFIYGTAIFILRSFCAKHMIALYDNYPSRGNGTKHTAGVKASVAVINTFKVYVDEMAKAYWLKKGGDPNMFYRSDSAVNAMFENLEQKMREWVNILKSNGI